MRVLAIVFLWACCGLAGLVAQGAPGAAFLRIRPELGLPLGVGHAEVPLAQAGLGRDPRLAAVGEVLRQHGCEWLRRAAHSRSSGLDNTYRLQFAPGTDLDAAIAALGRLPAVAFAERVPLHQRHYVPNDYDATQQWFLATIQAPAAWEVSRGCGSAVIAVVDDAVQINHPDLFGNIYVNDGEIPNNGLDDDNNGYVDDFQGYDAADGDPNPSPPTAAFNHGTHVSGCASAVSDNGLGVSGIGFNCRILPIKADADWSVQSFLTSTFEGVDYAVSTRMADVVNMSFGGGDYSQTWADLFALGHSYGITFVASAGNDDDAALFYPASHEYVISVAASNRYDKKASFSSYGDSVDVTGPGENIRSTVPFGGYGNFSGTSMSGPVVAGILGLMKAVNPQLGPAQLELLLEQTCDDIEALNPAYAGQLGAGRVNALAAVQAARLQNTAAPVAAFSYFNPDTCDNRVRLVYPCGSGGYPDSIGWRVTGPGGFVATASGPGAVIAIPAPGNYTLHVVAANGAGTDSAWQTVYLAGRPFFEVTAGGDAELCAGAPYTLSGAAVLGGVPPGGLSFQWSPLAGIQNAAVLNAVVSLPSSGVQTLTLAATDAYGCVRSDAVEVSIKPGPSNLKATATHNGQTVQDTIYIPSGASVQFLATGASQYQWAPFNWLNGYNIPNPVCTPLAPITYKVVGNLLNGCSAERRISVRFTGTGMGAGAGAGAWRAWPNPSAGEVYLGGALAAGGRVEVVLRDVQGRALCQLYSGQAEGGGFAAQFARPWGLAPGLYVLWVETEQGHARIPLWWE